MTSPVTLDLQDGIATLTLNRPTALNALSVDMMKALADATSHLQRCADLRAVVVTGAGDHFMAGGDLKDFATHLHLSPESRIATFRALIEQYINPSVEALAALPVPVIAQVRGACAGFGLSLVLGCDMAVAADSAYFTTAYASIALSGDGGVSWFLPRILGRRKAFELLLLADRFGADEALRLGVVNRVVPLEDLNAATDALGSWVFANTTADIPVSLSTRTSDMDSFVVGRPTCPVPARRYRRTAVIVNVLGMFGSAAQHRVFTTLLVNVEPSV